MEDPTALPEDHAEASTEPDTSQDNTCLPQDLAHFSFLVKTITESKLSMALLRGESDHSLKELQDMVNMYQEKPGEHPGSTS